MIMAVNSHCSPSWATGQHRETPISLKKKKNTQNITIDLTDFCTLILLSYNLAELYIGSNSSFMGTVGFSTYSEFLVFVVVTFSKVARTTELENTEPSVLGEICTYINTHIHLSHRSQDYNLKS